MKLILNPSGSMKLNVSFLKRIEQLFCKHNRGVGISCATQGINSKEGHYHVEYTCGNCGFSYGEWIKADEKEVEKLFDKTEWTIQ